MSTIFIERVLIERMTIVKKTFALIMISLLSLIACDPAIVIRQVDSPNNTISDITIKIKTSHELIGKHVYAPRVEIANTSSTPVKVTAVELISKSGPIQNHPQRSGTYPLETSTGKTETLDVWFDLPDTINKVFKDTVEFKVRYSNNRGELTASTFLNSGEPK